MKKITIKMSMMLIGVLIAATVNAQRFKIGNEFDVKISTTHPYNASEKGVVFEKEFFSEGAGYVKIHLKISIWHRMIMFSFILPKQVKHSSTREKAKWYWRVASRLVIFGRQVFGVIG